MKLTAIIALLVIALIQTHVTNGQRPETVLIVKVKNGWFDRRVDAYVKVIIGSATHMTKAVSSTDPYWNQSFTFYNPSSSFMFVQVWNRAKRDARGGDELLAFCTSTIVPQARNHPVKCQGANGFVDITYTC